MQALKFESTLNLGASFTAGDKKPPFGSANAVKQPAPAAATAGNVAAGAPTNALASKFNGSTFGQKSGGTPAATNVFGKQQGQATAQPAPFVFSLPRGHKWDHTLLCQLFCTSCTASSGTC